MKSITSTTIAITALLAVTYLLRSEKTQTKLSRLLQTPETTTETPSEQTSTTSFGGYTIKKEADIETYCTAKELTEDDLALSKEEQETYQGKLDRYYGGIRDPLEKIIVTQKATIAGDDVNKFFMWPVVATLSFWMFSMSCFPLLCCWCLFSGCCCKDKNSKKAGCCLKRRQAGEKVSCWVPCTTFSTIGLGGVIVFSLFFFFINAGVTVSKLKYMNCGLVIMYNDIVNGARKDDFFFAGAGGIDYMKTQITTSLEAIIQKGTVTLKAVVDQDMKTKGDTMKVSMGKLKSSYGTTITIVPVDGGTALAPASMTLLSATMSGIEAEVNALAKTGSDIHSAMDVAYQVAQDANGGMKKAIEDGFGAISTALKAVTDQMKDMKENALKVFDESQVKTPANLFIWVVCGAVGGFSIFILVILVMAVCFDKCKCLALTGGKFFMVIEMFCSIWINLVAAVLVLVAAVLVNVCYFFNKILNEESFVEKLSEDLAKSLKPCMYGDGSLKEMIGQDPSDMGGLDNLEKLTDGFDSLEEFRSVLGDGTPLPPVGKELATKLDAFSVAYSDVEEWKLFTDAGKSTPVALAATITSDLNSDVGVACRKDLFTAAASACGAKPVPTGDWTTGVLAGNTYCLTFAYLMQNPPATGQITARFNTACTGDHSSKVSTLMTFLKKYGLKDPAGPEADLQGFSPGDNFNSQVYSKEKIILANLKASLGTIDDIKDAMLNVKNFIKSLSSDIFGAFNCTIIKREFGIVQNVLCYQFTLNSARLSYSIMFMGISIFWFSLCLCCTIRCKRANVKKDGSFDGKDNKIQPKKGGGGKPAPMAYY